MLLADIRYELACRKRNSTEDCSALFSVFTGEQDMRAVCSMPCKPSYPLHYTCSGASRQVLARTFLQRRKQTIKDLARKNGDYTCCSLLAASICQKVSIPMIAFWSSVFCRKQAVVGRGSIHHARVQNSPKRWIQPERRCDECCPYRRFLSPSTMLNRTGTEQFAVYY